MRPAADDARRRELAALAEDPGAFEAHVALAELDLPGEHYRELLARVYEHLRPESVLEIGVEIGLSFELIPSDALAIGVDPHPRLSGPAPPYARIFAETSDAFFAARRLDELLGGRPLGAVFVDGLHLFEQVLRDVLNVEPFCGPRTVVMLHDTVPLNELTQTREVRTRFSTGDVWKAVPGLRELRPDLEVFTVATAWTGLTFVTGFRGAPSPPAARYDDVVARYVDAPYRPVTDTRAGLVRNDWELVRRRLPSAQLR